MTRRIEGGYHVDTISYNCKLVNFFNGAKKTYAKPKKLKKIQEVENCRSIKFFWNWLNMIVEQIKVQDTENAGDN